MNAYPLLAAALLAAPGAAQVAEDRIMECAVIVDGNERLDCFDRIATGLSAEAERVIAERREEEAERARVAAEEARRQEEARRAEEAEERRMSAEEAFGHEMVESGTGRPGQVIDQIESQIIDVFEERRRPPVMLLANGQLWAFQENVRRGIKAGDEVTIERAFGGSYEATTGFRTGRVKRLR